NLRFETVSGRDLAGFADAAFDLALAIDVVPYMIAAGPDVLHANMREAVRVTAPGGTLVVLNYSYRGEPEAGRADAAGLAAAHGLRLERCGERPFTLWDAAAFVFAKPGRDQAV